MVSSFRRGVRWVVASAVLGLATIGHAQSAQANSHAESHLARAVGAIKTMQGDSFIVTPDAGGEITAVLSTTTKIVRIAPGEKDLSHAVPLTPRDLQPGDRVRVRGMASGDGKGITALEVIVLKQEDVTARQQHDREDWQKRGVDGLVSAVDKESGIITISSGGIGSAHKVAVLTSKGTVLRRYADDSVKFEDAKPAPLQQIKPGDQLRARGTRSADGSELTAEEVVSGTFRSIAGSISGVDSLADTVTIQDAGRKAPVVVKITADSQMKKLPPEFAQRIAMRLKDGNNENGATPASGSASDAKGAPAAANGQFNLQRMLGRMPNCAIGDLQKGDVAMVLATGSGDSVTAITLLDGVEPILTATSGHAASTILSPWSLSANGGEGEGQP